MTIEQMRAAAGLGPEATDAEVIAAYSALATDQIFPITVEQVRVHLRYDRDDDSNDEHILDLLSRAVGWVESHTGQIMTARDVVEQFDSLDRVRLRAWPVKPDATLFVTYQDSDAATPLPARLSAIRRPAEVLPFIGARWPRLAAGTPITVTVRAGYEPTETIPGNLRTAILVMVTAYDEDREGGDVFMKAVKTATGLCRDFRNYRL